MTNNRKRVYLDYASSTPIDKRVINVMREAEEKYWHNASSIHTEGETAKNHLEETRISIARALHCRKEEVYFTSGGTESCNIVISGIVENALEKIKMEGNLFLPHIIVSSIEHPSILEPIKKLLKNKKIEISIINPNKDGLINPESVAREIKKTTVLVAIMHTNNEIGTKQQIRKISSLIKDCDMKYTIHKPYLFVDASQSIVYEDVSIERLGADVLVIDGIKMYGPRGIGALIIKHNIKVQPLMHGGGQENGIRPGTENIVGAIGLAEAIKICYETMESESKRIKKIRDYAISKILKEIPNSKINGSIEHRLPNNINVCFIGIDSEFLVIKLDTLGFAVSSASACRSASLNPSYVIESMGDKECASSSIRVTLGRPTKKSEVDRFIKSLKTALQ